MENSQNPKCKSCNQIFESQDRIPLLLPCTHKICFVCAFEQYQRKKQIQCALQSCGQISKSHPKMLQADIQFLQNIEEQMQLNEISKLEGQKAKVIKAKIQLAKMQTYIIQKLLQHLNAQVLKNNISLQQNLMQLEKKIEQQIQLLNQAKIQKKTQELVFQELNNNQVEQRVEELLNEVQKTLQQNRQVSLNVFEELFLLKQDLKKVLELNAKTNSQQDQQKVLVQQPKDQTDKYKKQIKILTQENNNLKNLLEQLMNDILEQQQNSNVEKNEQEQKQQPKQRNSIMKMGKTQNQPSQFIKIIIKSPNNKILKIYVTQKETVEQMKKRIQEKIGIKLYHIDLFKNKNYLEINQTVEELGLLENEKLEMRMEEG